MAGTTSAFGVKTKDIKRRQARVAVEAHSALAVRSAHEAAKATGQTRQSALAAAAVGSTIPWVRQATTA